MGRRGILAIAATSLIAVVLAGFGAVASTSSAEDSFVSRINSERTSRGLRAVTVASDLVYIARSWSAQMASDGAISHDPNLPNEVSNWSQLGDNVGRGPSVSTIHDAFMNSSAHRAIILDPAFTHVGVGVVSSGDRLYVTEIFVRRATKRVTTVRHTTTTRRRSTSQPQASTLTTVASDVELTGVMWEINLGPRGMTVSVLEQLNGLDAPSVNPRTGTPD
jgi:hypothetical protein